MRFITPFLFTLLVSSFAFGQVEPKSPPEKPAEAAAKTPQFQIEREKAVGEKIDQLQIIKGKTYKDVTIREVNEKGMSILHAGGLARIPLANLPYKLRKRFGYDPKKAAEEVKKEQETARAQVAERTKANEKTREARMEKDREHAQAMLSKKKQAKILELQKRMAIMQAGINKAHAEVESLTAKADDYRARGRVNVEVRDRNGRVYYSEKVTKSLLNRAATLDKRIAKIRVQIAEANSKIAQLAQQIEDVRHFKGD